MTNENSILKLQLKLLWNNIKNYINMLQLILSILSYETPQNNLLLLNADK